MVSLDLDELDRAARDDDFSGIVTVHVAGELRLERCYGLAHRAHDIPVARQTRFALASGSKIFTALAVMSLVSDGVLRLDQPVRELLGADLPLIDPAVTVEHLLEHASGIGDYLDEDAGWEVDDYVLGAPVHTLVTAEAFLPLLDGFAATFTPGERFAYCNGGYMVLAVILERVTGQTFHDVVRRRVLEPAGLIETDYLRLDELPGAAATGYLYATGDRANTLHLPVLGNGDGGAFSTVDELDRFWRAFYAGQIVPAEQVALMTRPRHDVPDEGLRHGLGMWLHATATAGVLEGYDAGVSGRSTHLPGTTTTVTVLGNTSEGAWPLIGVVATAVDEALAD